MQYQRSLHLVECLASKLRELHRGPNMVHFLKQQTTPRSDEALSEFAKTLENSIVDQENRKFREKSAECTNADSRLGHFFERHSWELAKSTGFSELNFAFQSLLQGYG